MVSVIRFDLTMASLSCLRRLNVSTRSWDFFIRECRWVILIKHNKQPTSALIIVSIQWGWPTSIPCLRFYLWSWAFPNSRVSAVSETLPRIVIYYFSIFLFSAVFMLLSACCYLSVSCLHSLSCSVLGGRLSQLEGGADQSTPVVNQHPHSWLL